MVESAGVSARATGRQVRAWPLAVPFLVAYTLFLAVPVAVTTGLSLFSGGLLNGFKFVGLQNYVTAWSDPVFMQTIENTAFYVVLIIPSVMALSLCTAVLLNSMTRFQNLVKVCIFLPLVSSVVPLATAWVPILIPGNNGVLNFMISGIGLPPQNWLGFSRLVIPSIALFELWRGFGLWTIIFASGLASIPEDLYEAARVDGASSLQGFIHITIPLLRPTFVFLMVMGFIWNFQLFDAIYVLTGGGPGYSSYTMAWYVYQNAFLYDQVGIAATMGVILLVITAFFALFAVRILREE